jgi:tetratricopeptide (TPR) repeat protein
MAEKSNPDTLAELGFHYFRLGEYQVALDRYYRAYQLLTYDGEDYDPAEATLFNNISACCFQLGNYALARCYAISASDIDPEFAAPYYNYALACHEDPDHTVDRTGNAACLLRAIELDPAFAGKSLSIKLLSPEAIRKAKAFALRSKKKSILPYLFVGTLLGAGVANKARAKKKSTLARSQAL